MNSISLRGRLTGHPYFNVVGKKRQAFLRFYLSVPGPRAEGDSPIRVVAYGRWVEPLYEQLNPGDWVAVVGRLRRRQNLDSLPATRANFITRLEAAGVGDPARVAEDLLQVVVDKIVPVYEVIAFHHQIHVNGARNSKEELDNGQTVQA